MRPLRSALSLAAALAAACAAGPQPAPADKADQAAEAAKASATAGASAGAAARAEGKDQAASAKEAGAAAAAAAQAKAAELRKGPPVVDEAALDGSADPCTDFYQYACGSWLKANPIPADKVVWSRSFSVIGDRNEQLLRQILEDAAAGKPDPENPYQQKLGDFYATCMDEEKAETASLATLRAELRKIDALKDLKGAAALVAALHLAGVNVFFTFGADQDAKEATQVIGIADQAGLGMPDRDFYLKPERKPLLDAYEQLVVHQLVNLGAKEKDAQAQARTVLKLETALAQASLDKVSRRDPNLIYHRIDRKGLAAAAPHFAWSDYFAGLGQPELTAVNVMVPDFFKGMDALLGPKAKLAELKTYLRWRMIAAATPTLGKKFVDEGFAFTSKLFGAKQLQPRWKRCVQMTDGAGLPPGALADATARSFVARAFSAQSKPMALEMIQRIEKAFEDNLATLGWMDAATQARAKEKVHKIANKIGFPDAWRDYSALELGRESLLKNKLAAAAFEARRGLAKIGKPVDRVEHAMRASLVNAEYNPTMNDMTFPAAILQPPFFSAESSPTSNYGAIGMVVGHELTHGFDDEGRQFDADGNLKDWWSKEAGEAYKAKAACVARQYSQYDAVEGQKLNGALTLGENIGDIGGLKMAYLAWKALRAGQPPSPQGSFTDEQQFFLAFGQGWCANYRPEVARLLAQTDVHSTAQWRVNGTVSDTPEFAAAFSCKAGSRMAPADRCQVW